MMNDACCMLHDVCCMTSAFLSMIEVKPTSLSEAKPKRLKIPSFPSCPEALQRKLSKDSMIKTPDLRSGLGDLFELFVNDPPLGVNDRLVLVRIRKPHLSS